MNLITRNLGQDGGARIITHFSSQRQRDSTRKPGKQYAVPPQISKHEAISFPELAILGKEREALG